VHEGIRGEAGRAVTQAFVWHNRAAVGVDRYDGAFGGD
jgi:hypothetical protein